MDYFLAGALASGYQQSSAFSVNSGGNNMMGSMGVQRMTSQMMPTPGFNNSNNNDVNSNSNSQSFMNVESSNNVGAFPAVESTIVSQPMQQKQHVGGQNSRILQNLGGPMGGSIRSTLQQKSYGLPNGPPSGGLGMMGNSMSLMNNPGTTEGYLAGTMYGNSPKPMLQHNDQHQRPVVQGTVSISLSPLIFSVNEFRNKSMCSDGYGIAPADGSVSGNLFVPVNSVGSMMNNQSLNAVSMSKTNSALLTNHSAVHSTQQVTNMKPQSIDQSEKMNFQPQYSMRENLVQPNQPQQLQQPSHQFQRQQLSQHQAQQRHQTQNQHLFKNDIFNQSQLSSSNIVSEAKTGPGAEHRIEGLQSQVSDPFQYTDMQSQQQNSVEDHSRNTQLLSHPSGPQDVCSALTQPSDQMQQSLHSQQFAAQNDFGSLSGCSQSDAALRGQWYPKSQDTSHVPGRLPLNHNVQDEFQHRLTGQNVAQLNNLSSEESMIGQSGASRAAEPPHINNTACRSNNLNRERQFKNQQRWLLFLRHARRCPSPEGQCQDSNCLTAQKLLKHMECCDEFQCSYPRCRATKILINHHRRCRDASCPVCIPVKNFVQAQLKAYARSELNSGVPGSVNGYYKSNDTSEIAGRSTQKTSPVIAETPEDLHPSIKRMKIEQGSQSLASESETSVALVSAVNEPPLQNAQHVEQDHESHIPTKFETIDAKMEVPGSVDLLCPKIVEVKKDSMNHAYIQKPEGDAIASNNPSAFGVQEVVKIEKEMGQAKPENTSVPSESASKSGKPKIKGVSMTELFTPEQVRQHITGLRQWIGQSKAKAEKNQAMEHSMSENCCQLCAVEKLTFEPPPLYCTPCGARIKRNAMYYTIGAGETRHYFCIPCYNEARGDTMLVEGNTIPKARMEKKKNDEETEEWWVQCDKCEAWQHQICALFNGRRNDGGQAEYTCPNCYITEVETGERMPLPQSTVLGAKDLPRTILSDRLEQRLFAKLKQERQDRARIQGKSYDEVPGAESLVVRVVSSVDKKLEVKPRFLEIFQDENYPTEYPYKSKV
ncbi:hypothetical protein RD792_000155 [Penstemon davidsonii]|uniref:histone acetyltransferase n=1 Tax=Penstemon davidsonii TaxID=160366 RepID=A0ABR0DUE8_9LAMI|nr:hypothetical protein RD792_000155 [Penstemon davidsonii]